SVPLIFSHATTEVYGLIKIAAIELFALALLVLLVIQAFLVRPGRMQGAGYLALAFFVVAGISLIKAINIFAGMESLYLLAAYLIIFFAVLANIETVREARKLIASGILACVFACCWSIYQNKGLSFSTSRFSYYSTFGNPIFFSQYLTAMIPLAIAMIFTEARSLSKASLFFRQAFYLAALALSMALLVMTRSLGAYLGMGIAVIYCYVVVLFSCSVRIRRIIAGLSVALLVLGVTAGGIFWPKVQANLGERKIQNLMRVHVWASSFNIIKAHPILGVGAGNFEYAYPLYRTPKEKAVTPRGTKYTQAHNQILQIWSEMGILGLLVFLGILFYAFRKSVLFIKTKKKQNAFNEIFLMAGTTSALAALLVQSLFNPMLEIPTSGFLFWLLLALVFTGRVPAAGTAGRAVAKHRTERRAAILKITGGMVCAALFFLGPAHIFRNLMGDYFLEKARAAEGIQDTKEAVSKLERSLRAYPHNWKALFFSGKIHQAMGAYQEAVKYYERAVRYHPNYTIIWNNLGSAYMQDNKLDETIAAFKRVVEIDESYVGAHYNLSLAYKKSGQAELAERQIERLDSIDPIFLGNMYLGSGIFDEAALEFHKAIRRDPNNTEAHFKLAEAWQRQDKIDKAIQMYKRTVELQPAHVEAYIALAELYRNKGEMDEAISAYESSLQAIPKKMDKLYEDVLLYSDLGIYAQVLEEYKDIEELDKVKLDVYRQLALIYKSKGQNEKAIESYEELSKMIREDVSVWEELAGIYEKQGMFTEAKDAYSRIAKLRPGSGETLKEKILLLNRIAAYHALASIYEDQGMTEKAIAKYKEALEFEPQGLYAWRKIGELYAKSGKFQDAEDVFERIIEEVPMDVGAHIALGDLFSQAGQIEDAYAEYAQAVEIAPYDSRGSLALAGLYRRQERLDEAVGICGRGITLSPRDVRLRFVLATLMEERRQFSEAINEYKEILRIETDNKEARIRLDALQDVEALK
ncbi:MAG: tetratricopeptide repeat protein, partial [Candidatus Omnitrophica bacterium]|nr:tetratricopeptide repeat protein [Candidatus Omnitrophota bacterium]